MSVPTTIPAGKPARVQLLVTCLVDHFAPDTAEAVVRVLERQGIEVRGARETRPAAVSLPAMRVRRPDAVAMARHTIAVLERDPGPVVIPSGSCTDMLVHQAPALLAGDPAWAERAAAVAARTYEFTQFLVDVLGVTVCHALATGTLAYHACCHGLRGVGIERQPRQLLEHVLRRQRGAPSPKTTPAAVSAGCSR